VCKQVHKSKRRGINSVIIIFFSFFSRTRRRAAHHYITKKKRSKIDLDNDHQIKVVTKFAKGLLHR
jgi:hypothetical protein